MKLWSLLLLLPLVLCHAGESVASEEWHPRRRGRRVLHLVVTRFQQYQPALLSLGRARLQLFNTFCYPSMKQQTTQNFVWLILTDPSLHSWLRTQMESTLAGHPNYFLLPRLGFLTSEPFLAGDMAGQETWTGSPRLWKTLTEQNTSMTYAVHLHTRLDADDALHKQYFQQLQADALRSFQPNLSFLERNSKKSPHVGTLWKYYCLIGEAGRRVLEWHYSETDSGKDLHSKGKGRNGVGMRDLGTLAPSIVEKQCISAGMTFAFVTQYRQRQNQYGDAHSHVSTAGTVGEKTLTHFSHAMHYPLHAKLWNNVKEGVFGECHPAGKGTGERAGGGGASSTSSRGRREGICISAGTESGRGRGSNSGMGMLPYYALRARTPTSTGMNRIAESYSRKRKSAIVRWLDWLTTGFAAASTTAGDSSSYRHEKKNKNKKSTNSDDIDIEYHEAQTVYWRDAALMFGISNLSAVAEVVQCFRADMPAILRDAIAGHCQPDLTCKKDSLQKLQGLLATATADSSSKTKTAPANTTV